MNISERQRKILKDITKEIVTQSPHHKENITEYYQIIQDAVVNEFTEDNVPTTKAILQECHQEALNTLWPDEMLGTAATARYEAEMNREPTLIEKIKDYFTIKPKAPVSDHSAKLSRQYDKLVKNMDKAHGLYEPCPLCNQPRVYNTTNHTIVCIPCNGSRNATDQEIIDYAKRETIRKDLMEKEILEKQKIVDNIDLHAVVKKYFF